MVKVFLVLVLIFGGLLLLVNLPVAAAPEATTASSHIIEYPIGVPGSQPGAIAVEAPGRVWFTMPGTDQIGRLVVDSGGSHDFDFFDLDEGSDPYGIVYDGQYIWFTAMGGNYLGRLDPAAPAGATPDKYPAPTPESWPADIDVAPNGQLWLTEMNASQLALFDPQIGDFVDEYPYTRNGNPTTLDKIFVINVDAILFTVPDQDQVVEFTPSKANIPGITPFTVYPVSDPSDFSTYSPADVTVNEKGYIWITVPGANALALFSALTQQQWAFSTIPTPNAYPTAITASVEDNYSIIWFVERDSGQVGQLVRTLSGKTIGFREHLLPTAESQPSGIAVDSAGHAWISEAGADQIAEWRPPYFNHSYLSVLTRQ
jgi:virginiamycin B lyase